MNSLNISPARILLGLLLIVFTLVFFHVASLFLGYYSGSEITLTSYQILVNLFSDYFHMAGEANVPTYFSSFLLGAAAVILYIISKLSSLGRKYHWLALSFIFIFLSLDEATRIHEVLGWFFFSRNIENLPSFLSEAWVIPYSMIALVVGFVFFKFTLSLPPKTRILFFISGFIYVFAALGLEFPEAYFEKTLGVENFINPLLFIIEESLEMVGVIIFVYALLDYLSAHEKCLTITVSTRITKRSANAREPELAGQG